MILDKQTAVFMGNHIVYNKQHTPEEKQDEGTCCTNGAYPIKYCNPSPNLAHLDPWL